jgi:hypothetical protein
LRQIDVIDRELAVYLKMDRSLARSDEAWRPKDDMLRPKSRDGQPMAVDQKVS